MYIYFVIFQYFVFDNYLSPKFTTTGVEVIHLLFSASYHSLCVHPGKPSPLKEIGNSDIPSNSKYSSLSCYSNFHLSHSLDLPLIRHSGKIALSQLLIFYFLETSSYFLLIFSQCILSNFVSQDFHSTCFDSLL